MPKQRCTATKSNGERCKSYPAGVWHLCSYHGGKPLPTPKPCRCAAYRWPHRCGGGVCRWPLEPTHPCLTPEHTHKHSSRWQARTSAWKKLFAAAEKADRDAAWAAVERFRALQRELQEIAARPIEGLEVAPRGDSVETLGKTQRGSQNRRTL